MNYKSLLKKYSEIESRIIPIVNYLESNKNTKGIKGVYKGIITLQSPIIYQPEVLFIGVNPGEGAYKVLNNEKSKEIKTPLRMIGKDETFLKELNWYELGNARGGFINDKWQNFKWYQRDEIVNNSFPQRMIDLLYEIARLKFPNDYKENQYDNNSMPFWFETFGKNIMYSNLYPIATLDITDLYKLLNLIVRKNELKVIWENETDPNNWDVRKFFLGLTDELIDLVQPKIIVCMGKSTFDDFLYNSENRIYSSNNDKIYTTIKKDIPIIGFSRQGNWSGLLTDIAKKIVSKHK